MDEIQSEKEKESKGAREERSKTERGNHRAKWGLHLTSITEMRGQRRHEKGERQREGKAKRQGVV